MPTSERRLDYLKLNNYQISILMQPVVGNAKILNTQLVTSGMLNTNYIVSTNKEKYFLKIYIRDKDLCRKEYLIYQKLNKLIPTPTIFYINEGDLYNDIYYIIMEYVEGVDLNEALIYLNEDSSSLGCSLGKVLGELSKVKFQKSGIINGKLDVIPFNGGAPTSFFNFIEDCVYNRKANERLEKKLKDKIIMFVEKNSPLLADINEDTCLVHGDFNKTNILISKNDYSSVISLVDWEFAQSGTQLFDIAVLLRDDEQIPKCFIKSFIREYENIAGKLHPDWYRLSKLIDLINLCDLLCTDKNCDNLFSYIKFKINHLIQYWDNLNYKYN